MQLSKRYLQDFFQLLKLACLQLNIPEDVSDVLLKDLLAQKTRLSPLSSSDSKLNQTTIMESLEQ